ncbi:MAG TPA: type 1 glutamine amidotransferase [Phycisphaerales bacterium]|nr:type 1 glutamine amidotransferase [Phycisphaerales bacterium]
MKKIAVILTQDYEDSEASDPIERLKKEGMDVTIVAPEKGETYSGKQGEFEIEADLSIQEADPENFDALLIPGGHSPESLRLEKGAVAFVEHFVQRSKPIAAICHGPQLLISANGVEGRRMTSFESIRIDLKNAGAKVLDEEVVVDCNIVTSRTPDDIPAFNDMMIEVFQREPALT